MPGVDASEPGPNQRLEPIIPSSGEIEQWRNVDFHYTRADRVIPILYQGVWSVAFSHKVNQPIEPSGFSPVQEEVGWNKISVLDANDPQMDFRRVVPIHDRVILVLKRIPAKSEPAKAERRLFAERLVDWRIRPRDIIALWVSQSITGMSVEEFVDQEITEEGFKRMRHRFDSLGKNDRGWRQKMIKIGNEESDKVSAKYPGAHWSIKGDIANRETTKRLALEWLDDRYQIGPQGKIIELLREIQEDSGVRIYQVTSWSEGAKAIPISD